MAFVYNRAARLLAADTGRINYLADVLKFVLVTTGYVADRDHDFVNAIGANELGGTGYVAGFGGSGRHVIAGKTILENDVSNRAEFGATNPSWSTIDAGTVGAMLLVRENASDADSDLIAYLDGTPVLTTGVGLTVTIPGGICFYLGT